MIDAGKVKPMVDPTHYTLETIGEAYDAIKQRTAKGKVVIEIG